MKRRVWPALFFRTVSTSRAAGQEAVVADAQQGAACDVADPVASTRAPGPPSAKRRTTPDLFGDEAVLRRAPRDHGGHHVRCSATMEPMRAAWN